MAYLGIDYGERRIGLAFGDELGLAIPIDAAVESKFDERMAHILSEINSRNIRELVVGYPLNMDGSVGFKAKEVDSFIDKLIEKIELPVHRVDERLSSHYAKQQMGLSGLKERQTRASGKIDSASATVILQDFLDSQFPPPPVSPDADFEE